MNDQFRELVIRTGVARQKDIGYIFACDPETEMDEPHAKIFRWHQGTFSESWASFNAHSACLISVPDPALVFVASDGSYGVHGKKSSAGNIFRASSPAPVEPRYGDIRWVSEISGKAFACGHTGAVYRLDALNRWTRIDQGVPTGFNIEAIHGFDDTDIYAVGNRGEAWRFDGQQWQQIDLPTNLNLTRVKCAADGLVYIAGHKGLLMRGRDRTWSPIDQQATTGDIWGLEWFAGKLYVSTMARTYYLRGDSLEVVEFGDDPPRTHYHLSAASDVMWSIGEEDIVAFDGRTWTRIV